ncbi:hypothetical protein OR61_22325, partial [Xanthomonas vesicatoria]
MVPHMFQSSDALQPSADMAQLWMSAAIPGGMRVPAKRNVVLAGVLLTLCMTSGQVAAQAEDPPAFDRPGIPFAAEVLQPGAFAWEQGLPDASTDRAEGQRTTLYTADTVLRLGLSQHVELQLGSDSYNWQHGGGAHAHGGGDSHVGLKVALPSRSESFHWAALGTYS